MGNRTLRICGTESRLRLLKSLFPDFKSHSKVDIVKDNTICIHSLEKRNRISMKLINCVF
jgi:hypothetical protein